MIAMQTADGSSRFHYNTQKEKGSPGSFPEKIYSSGIGKPYLHESIQLNLIFFPQLSKKF